MTPPFFDTNAISTIVLDDILPFVDKERLFTVRWQFRRGLDAASWENMKRNNAIPAFERVLAQCRVKKIITPRILYGYFHCKKQGNTLVVDASGDPVHFDFPRERKSPNRCLADFFPDSFVTFQLVTVGNEATKEGARLFSDNAYNDAFLLKGFAAEAAEATAIFGYRHIQKELGVAEKIGERFSPGYPSFPNLFDQRKIATLLNFMRVGVVLTQTCQLVPEYSTTAIISIDPKAAHFRP